MSQYYRGADDITAVAVIGAGLIGSGWIATFLANGLAVSVFDPSPGAEADTRERLDNAWPLIERLGLPPRANRSALSFHATVEEALARADFVQENVPERLDLKMALYRELDGHAAPDVLIASSTSSFAITDLQKACAHPQRCLLGHPINPVHLVPLVEIAGGETTAPAAIDAAIAFYTRLGKKPARLQREVFGHVANRLAAAMFQEAVHLVSEGVIGAAALDDVIRYGPALKWVIQGQYLTYHTSGGAQGIAGFLDHFGPGQMRRWRDLGRPNLTEAATRDKIVAGVEQEAAGRSVGEITAAQDEALVALRRLLG